MDTIPDWPAGRRRRWSWDDRGRGQAGAQRAALLVRQRAPGPFHVAVLLDNVPEFAFWLGAAALAGAVMVGANPTHRGADLARDLAHTECPAPGDRPSPSAPGGRARPRRRHRDRVGVATPGSLVDDSDRYRQTLGALPGARPPCPRAPRR